MYVNYPEISGLRQVDFEAGQDAGFSKFKDLVQQRKFVTWDYLKTRIRKIKKLHYNQVQSMVTELQKRLILRTELNKFEIVLNSGSQKIILHFSENGEDG